MRTWIARCVIGLCLFSMCAPCTAQAPSTPLTPPGAEVFRLDLSNAGAWTAQVSWLSNPDPAASIERIPDGLQFTVPTAGKGMKWSTSLPPVGITEQRFLVMRYKASNLNPRHTDYAVHLDDGTKKQFNTVLFTDLVPDGEWHVLVVYLPARTKAASVSGKAATQVQAGPQGKGCLLVSDLLLTDAISESLFTPDFRAQVDRLEGAAKEGLRLAFRTTEGWTEQPTWFERDLAGKASVAVEGAAARFTVEGPARSRMKWSFNPSQQVDAAAFPYVAVRYKARNLGKANDYALYVGGSTTGAITQGAPVLFASDLECDGAWHVACGRVAEKAAQVREIAVQVEVGKEGRADLWVDWIAFLDRPVKLVNELPEYSAGLKDDARDFQLISLPAGGSDREATTRALNLRSWFSAREITVGGVPFRLGDDASASVATALRGGESQAAVPASGKASEVWLLLGAKFRGEDEPGFGGPRHQKLGDERTVPNGMDLSQCRRQAVN